MLKVVIDTNIIISALNFGGAPDEVVSLVWEGRICLVISPFILEESAGVLQRKFQWTESKVRLALDRIRANALLVLPQQKISVIKECEPDNRILECAVEGQAQYIVSGDKHHLLPLREFNGIGIVSPSEFLRMYHAL